MGVSHTRVSFCDVNELVVPIFLGTTYIDRFIKSINSVERKIIPHHSQQVPMLIVQEVRSEAEINQSDTRQKREEDLALLIKLIESEPDLLPLPDK